MKRIDLHIHTTASDGTATPEEVVREASRLGLAAIAITDHDTAGGYVRAAAEAEKTGLEVVPGIEISTKYGGPVHILAEAKANPLRRFIRHGQSPFRILNKIL